MNPPSTPTAEPGGHARTVGTVIVSLGALLFVIALVVTQLLGLELRFISGEGMMLFAGVYVIVGAQQILTGRRLDQATS